MASSGRSIPAAPSICSQSGLTDFEFPIHPDFILTSERDVFRPSCNGGKWEPFGDWNERVAREHAELFQSAESVLAEVVDFVNQKTKARLLYHSAGLEGLVAENEEELERVTQFIDRAREKQPKFHYQRNTVYLRFCHADYHKGAALAELSRLLEIPREEIFAAGDHHNDISMLDGRYRPLSGLPGECDLRSERSGRVGRWIRRLKKLRRRRPRSIAPLRSEGLAAVQLSSGDCNFRRGSSARISSSAGHWTALSMSRNACR